MELGEMGVEKDIEYRAIYGSARIRGGLVWGC